MPVINQLSELNVPPQVKEVLYRLEEHYYSAYIVGKCVRELIIGNPVMDFDVITNASPERLVQIFRGYPTVDDNIARGELIVKVLGMAILVTPYISSYDRSGVPFYTDDIVEDLARREFSMNAIAYCPEKGYIDPFNGINMLREGGGTVAAIGEEQIFSLHGDTAPAPKQGSVVSALDRNPITILQALGYYSTGDFDIAENTRLAILKKREKVLEIPIQALRTELAWILRGKRAAYVLEEYTDIFVLLIPEIRPLIGFNPHRPEHYLDMWTHTLKSVGFASPILTLRFAMLFHDLGKPDCFSIDGKGIGHYYGYEERSMIIAERIMERLGFLPKDIDEIGFIILNQRRELGDTKRQMKLMLREMTPDHLKMLLQFRYANMKAKSAYLEEQAAQQKQLVDAVNRITAFHECYSLETLAISKRDLMQRGITSGDAETDELLEKLLNFVIDSPSFNTPNRLIDLAAKDISAKRYSTKA